MKNKFYLGSLVVIVILLLIVSDCSPSFQNKLYHDKYNPCGTLSPDSVECENWKTNFPKDYEKYLKRIEKDSIN